MSQINSLVSICNVQLCARCCMSFNWCGADFRCWMIISASVLSIKYSLVIFHTKDLVKEKDPTLHNFAKFLVFSLFSYLANRKLVWDVSIGLNFLPHWIYSVLLQDVFESNCVEICKFLSILRNYILLHIYKYAKCKGHLLNEMKNQKVLGCHHKCFPPKVDSPEIEFSFHIFIS